MTVTIERVDGRRGVARFVDAAWRVREMANAPAAGAATVAAPVAPPPGAGAPSRWIPPLRLVVKDMLDTKRNPFYDEADRALFLASKGGEVVGRIAAVENRWHNRHHGDRTGFFGFFECIDDPDVARALLGAAEAWLAERGLTSARGPISPSMNHESGLLVDGFDTDPVLMTPWDPPYAGPLLEAAGYRGVQDLLAYWVATNRPAPDRLRRLAERTTRRTRITFRELDVRTLEREARRVHVLYNQAWAGNWGFVPPSWEEFWHTAKDLEGVLARGFSFVAEIDGEVVGFMMIARDVNRVLRHMPSGRLWPWNVVRLLRAQRVPAGRVVLLGMTPEWRNRGLLPLFVHEAVRRAYEEGAEGAEASWILEQNEAMRAPLEALGLQPYKRWRIYEKVIGADGT